MLRPFDYWVAFALLSALVFLGGWRLVPRVSGVFHDDAIYVITAKALAQGDGYRLINLPGAPPQTKYPILFPAVLATIWKVWPAFPDNLIAMQMVSLLAAGAAMALSYLYLVRFSYCSRLTAAVAVLLALSTPTVLYISTLTLSEMTFAFLLVVALWRVESDLQRETSSSGAQFLTGMILAAPYHCRTVGLPVALVAIAVLAWHRKPVRWTVAGCALAVAPWLAWTAVATVRWRTDPIIGYYTDYVAGWSPFTAQGLGVALINFLLICRDSIGLVISGFYSALDVAGLRVARWLMFPGAYVLFHIARRSMRTQLLPCCLLAYVGMICLWPWPPWRFFVPILPFLVVYVSDAYGEIARRFLRNGRHRSLMGLAAAAVVVLNLVLDVSAGRLSRQVGYPYHFAPRVTDQNSRPVFWTDFEDMFRWVQSHVGPNDVVASGLDTMLSLYTGRPAFRPWIHRPESLFYGGRVPATGTPDEFVTILKSHGARYLVVFPLENFSEAQPFATLVQEVLEERPGLLTIVYQGADPRFTAYEIHWGRDSATE
jgi:hypothetical protein